MSGDVLGGCRVPVERPEGVEDFVWVSRDRGTVDITVPVWDDEGDCAMIPFPLYPEDARLVAMTMLRLADEIDGKGMGEL